MDEKKMFADKGNKNKIRTLFLLKKLYENILKKPSTCIDLDSFYSRSLSASKWFKLRKLFFNT